MSNPDIWDDSAQGSLAATIYDQITNMPDRPKVVVAAFNWEADRRAKFASEMSKFGPALLRTFGIAYFNLPADVAFLGFNADSDDMPLCKFFETVRALPIDEAIVYIDGVSKIRLAPTKKNSSTSI